MARKLLNQGGRQFNYPWFVRAFAIFSYFLFFISAAAFNFFHQHPSDGAYWVWTPVNCLGLLIILTLAILCLYVFTMFRPIIINDEVIGIYNPEMFRRAGNADSYLGRQVYPWTTVTRIEKHQSFVPYTGRSAVMIFHGRFGFGFNGLLSDYDEVLSLIDRYASIHGIPVVERQRGRGASS
jgi:hypothetical protein